MEPFTAVPIARSEKEHEECGTVVEGKRGLVSTPPISNGMGTSLPDRPHLASTRATPLHPATRATTYRGTGPPPGDDSMAWEPGVQHVDRPLCARRGTTPNCRRESASRKGHEV